VHVSTVSRALNPDTRKLVADDVVAKINAVAEELAYRRDSSASGLRTRSSHTIGVILPDITNAIFPDTVHALEAILATEGYSALVAHAESGYPRHRLVIEHLTGHRVDAVVIFTARRHDAIMDYCAKVGLPVVSVNRAEPGQPSVINDDLASMRLVVDYVRALGHSRIAHVAGPANTDTGVVRRQGFEVAMRAAGAPPDAIEISQSYTRAEGYRCAAALLAAHPQTTTLVTANDMLAIGCIEFLTERRLNCPRDISVTGHNNAPLTDAIDPPLTTVALDAIALGENAGRLVLRRLRDPYSPAETIVMQPRLIVRGSVATARKRSGP
jgi:LacI family transcriptional regulator